MLTKVGKDWQFTSENNLEDFVWGQLTQLFELFPLKRQYGIFDSICDILATDKDGRLVIIELKNAVDRHIVQQLTRYYHSLLEEKPFQAQINYQLPARLIAIAPSFHRHSWIDRQYHQLIFEFMSFTIKQQHNQIYLHITDLTTQKLLQAKILDTSLIRKVKISQPRQSTLVEEDGELRFTKVLDDMLSYYVLVRNAYKLGLPELEASEIERLNNQGYPIKVSKTFKIRVAEKSARSGFREVSIKVPSSIQVGTFMFWVGHKVPTAIEVITPNGHRRSVWHSKNYS